MIADSTSQAVPLDISPLDHVSNTDDLGAIPPTPPDSPTPPIDKVPVTEAYYYQKLRESADRFAHQLSTSKYVDDVETTWRGFDDKKKEWVITSAMRYISFDPEPDFKRFDDLAMAAMTSVLLNIVRNAKRNTKKPVGNALLRRAIVQAAGDVK